LPEEDAVAARTKVWSEPSTNTLADVGYSGAVTVRAGRMADRLSNAAEIYGGLSVDSVLKGFREKRGLAAPGTGLGGWAKVTTEATFGQWVSGLARLSRSLADPSLAMRAVDLVDGYAATLPPDKRTGMGIYGWEKLVCGLVDAAEFAGYRPALELLSQVARADAFDQTRAVPVPNDFAGAGPAFTPEWYTLAENLYKGFKASGDDYLGELAQSWHYETYWGQLARQIGSPEQWDIPVWLHAYSHVNTLASAAAAYDVHREPRYRAAVENGHDWMRATQCYATGGYGPSELTVPADGTLGRALEWRNDTAEIVCGTWAVFKLGTWLLRETGDPRYLDWPEQLLYNGLDAALPMTAGGGSPYYSDYRLGWATKQLYWEQWPCCSGTYAQAVAHIPTLVYQATGDGVAVCLFVASRVSLEVDGRPVVVEQRTGFPEEDKVQLRVVADKPLEMTLRVRLPPWSGGTVISLNGERLPMSCGPGQWAAVRKAWTSADVLTVHFEMQLEAKPVDTYHPDRVAITYGPVVLAQQAAWSAPFSASVPWPMVKWGALLKRSGPGLVFTPVAPGTARMPTGAFRPLYDFGEHEPYRVYHDLDRPRII
jgi:hypothetical protein